MFRSEASVDNEVVGTRFLGWGVKFRGGLLMLFHLFLTCEKSEFLRNVSFGSR